jgi:hypothetical protein
MRAVRLDPAYPRSTLRAPNRVQIADFRLCVAPAPETAFFKVARYPPEHREEGRILSLRVEVCNGCSLYSFHSVVDVVARTRSRPCRIDMILTHGRIIALRTCWAIL